MEYDRINWHRHYGTSDCQNLLKAGLPLMVYEQYEN